MNLSRKRRSGQDLRQPRKPVVRVARTEHLAVFKHNLSLPTAERCYLFNIWGQGGVGKSTLIEQLIEVAQTAHWVTTYTDESATGVLKTMAHIAEQLHQQGHPLPRFSDRYKVYRQKKQELENDPEAPQGLTALLTRTATKAGVNALKSTPVIGTVVSVFNEEEVSDYFAAGASWIAKRLSHKKDDINLALHPIEELTPLFLEDLRAISERTRLIVFFDTHECTVDFLDDWLLEILEEQYGDRPDSFICVIAGRKELDPNRWGGFCEEMISLPLEPFSESETKHYLEQKGITAPQSVDLILRLSAGLPLLVATLASKAQIDPKNFDDPTDTAIKRFLHNVEPKQYQMSLSAALPRLLNLDIILLLHDDESTAVELFDWLQAQAFVKKKRQGWVYHDVARTLFLRYFKDYSPRRWQDLHGKIEDYYAQLRSALQLDEERQWTHETWQDYTLHLVYHRLCKVFHQISSVLSDFLSALKCDADYARRYAETIAHAGESVDVLDLEQLGKMLLDGLKSFEDKQYEAGIEMLTRLLTQYPLDAHAQAIALGWRGDAQRLIGRYQSALQDLNQALNIEPDDTWAIVCRSSIYRKLKQYEPSLHDCSRSIALNPHYSWAFTSRGETYLCMECYEEALADFNHAIAIDPNNNWPIGSRGKAYKQMRRYAEAQADFSALLDIDPHNTWALASRGFINRQLGEYEAALQDFDRAIALKPNSVWDIASRAETYRQMECYEQAIQDFNTAIQLDPKNAWALCRRGEVYLLQKRYDDALADFKQAVELNSQNDWRLFMYAVALKAAGYLDQAAATIKLAIELAEQRYQQTPQKQRITLTLALYYLFADNYKQSETLYRVALSQDLPMALLQEAIRSIDDCQTVVPDSRFAQVAEKAKRILQKKLSTAR